jgi:hypothetical protein
MINRTVIILINRFNKGGNLISVDSFIPIGSKYTFPITKKQKALYAKCLCLAQPPLMKWNQVRNELISMWSITIKAHTTQRQMP